MKGQIMPSLISDVSLQDVSILYHNTLPTYKPELPNALKIPEYLDFCPECQNNLDSSGNCSDCGYHDPHTIHALSLLAERI